MNLVVSQVLIVPGSVSSSPIHTRRALGMYDLGCVRAGGLSCRGEVAIRQLLYRVHRELSQQCCSSPQACSCAAQPDALVCAAGSPDMVLPASAVDDSSLLLAASISLSSKTHQGCGLS